MTTQKLNYRSEDSLFLKMWKFTKSCGNKWFPTKWVKQLIDSLHVLMSLCGLLSLRKSDCNWAAALQYALCRPFGGRDDFGSFVRWASSSALPFAHLNPQPALALFHERAITARKQDFSCPGETCRCGFRNHSLSILIKFFSQLTAPWNPNFHLRLLDKLFLNQQIKLELLFLLCSGKKIWRRV